MVIVPARGNCRQGLEAYASTEASNYRRHHGAESTSKNAASAQRVSPTPSARAKRERSDDEEEEETRRVSQRTNEGNDSGEAAGAKATMDELVLEVTAKQ